jgi:capsular polysaccharide biosynthesis protein
MKRIPRQIAGLLLMGAGLALTTLALVMLWLAPEVFVATAQVTVPPPAPEQGTAAKRMADGAGWDSTELERIQAKVVLYQVITNLELQRKWAEQFKEEDPLPVDRAYQLLKKHIVVRHSNNYYIIKIRVESYDRNEAATLANRIAEVYRDTRRAAGVVVEVVESALPPPKGRRSGGANALALFLVGLAGLGAGYWVLRSAGLLGPPTPS